MLELGTEDAGVNIIEPAIEAETMNIARIRAMVSKLADSGIYLFVIGDERSAVAEGPEIFLNDKAGGGCIA